MSSYRVVNPFQAFEREYKRGQVLTDEDMSCWLPDEDRPVVVDGLIAQGKLEAVGVETPEAKMPPTWGGDTSAS